MDGTRLTVKEIARLAGVSIGTVDRVLHGRAGVSAATKKKIEGIVSSLGYEPNILARQLSLNRSYVLRVVLPLAAQDSGYWSLCLAGVERAARDNAPYGVRVLIEQVDRYDRRAFRELLARIVADPGDGLAFAPFLPDELLPALKRLDGKVPYVFFDGSVEGAHPLAVVAQDAYRGGFLAGRIMSLIAPAEGRLLAIGVHAEVGHIRRRIEGFRAYFAQAGGASGAAASPAASSAPRREISEEYGAVLEKEGDCDGVLERAFERHGPVAGIMVANSAGHLVGDWLRDRGFRPGPRGPAGPGNLVRPGGAARPGNPAGAAGPGWTRGVALLSWDLVPDNARALREGLIDCALSQRPADQGREAVEALVRAVVLGGGPEVRLDIPLEIYFKENLPLDEGGERGAGPGGPLPLEAP